MIGMGQGEATLSAGASATNEYRPAAGTQDFIDRSARGDFPGRRVSVAPHDDETHFLPSGGMGNCLDPVILFEDESCLNPVGVELGGHDEGFVPCWGCRPVPAARGP